MAGCFYLLLLLLFLSITILASGQQGFISIDCGKPDGYTYTDSLTGLGYVSDSQYIDEGENHEIASEFRVSTTGNDLRSFPNGTRNCYNLKPVTRGKKYLVRTWFIYGNYDGKNQPPLFVIYLGTDLWASINSSLNYFYDIMTMARANYISICLVRTGSGVPFISAIELRPIPDDGYEEIDAMTSLIRWYMEDYGGQDDIRYPRDIIDRYWEPFTKPDWRTIAAVPNSIIGTANSYNPPEAVMMTAVAPINGSTLKLSYPLDKSKKYHYFLHFVETELLKPSENRTIDILVNGAYYSSLSPKYMSIITDRSLSPRVFTSSLEISLVAATGSTLPPIVNAAEVYNAIESTENITDSGDVDAIMDIKATYNLKKNWMGDPCAPREFIWDGLNCSYSTSSFDRIIALNLTSSGLTGQLSASFAKITELMYLDLSNNTFTGEIPKFLESLSQLKLLNLSNSGLSLPVPQALQDRANSGNLVLSTEGLVAKPSAAVQEPVNSKKKRKIIVIAVIVSICAIVLILVVAWLIWKWTKKTPTQNREIQIDLPPRPPDYREFSYTDLHRITDGFKSILGKGGFGTVFYGILRDGTQVAVKMLSALSFQGLKEFQAEAELLMRIHHKNLVTLVGYCNDKDHLALVYECMEQGSVADHLSGTASGMNALGWGDRLRIASEAAQGLEYLHEGCKSAIVHRDVKTSNILLTQKFEAKISDFGLSRTFDHDRVTQISTAVKGTLGYLDPCYYSSNKLNEKSDIYAFGIVLLELITGLPAIIRNPEIIHIVTWVKPSIERGELENIMDERIRGRLNSSNSIWKAVDIALSCVHPNPDQRPLMSQVVNLLKECLVLERTRSKQVPSNVSGPTSTGFDSGDASFVMSPSAR